LRTLYGGSGQTHAIVVGGGMSIVCTSICRSRSISILGYSLECHYGEKHTGIGVDNQSIDLETHNAAPHLKNRSHERNAGVD
jgi:hypothetical protein